MRFPGKGESFCQWLGPSLEGGVGITGCPAAGSLGTCGLPVLSWVNLGWRNV